jgi:hypothetical protein
MKSCGLIIALLFSLSLYAETTVKNSAPFSFPTAVGVGWGDHSAFGNEALFAGKTRSSGTHAIDFSWALSSKAKSGSISLFTVTGARVKTIPITSQSGSVSMDMSGGKLSRGVYFAKLSYGTYEKTINFIAYR